MKENEELKKASQIRIPTTGSYLIPSDLHATQGNNEVM